MGEQPRPLWTHVPDDAALTVARMSVIAGVSGATLGAVRGVLFGSTVAPTLLAGELARSWFMLSLGFFALREYAVLPYAREYYPSIIGSGHTHHLLPSMLAGGTLGAAFSALQRRRLAGGTWTIGLMCTGMQLLANETRIIGKRLSQKGEAADTQPAPVPAPQSAPAPPKDAEKSTISLVLSFLARNSPVQQLSDAEYIERLRKRESELVRELVVIERDLAYYRSQLPR